MTSIRLFMFTLIDNKCYLVDVVYYNCDGDKNDNTERVFIHVCTTTVSFQKVNASVNERKKMCLVKGARIAEVVRLSYDLEPSTQRIPTITHSVNPAPACVPECK
ncbi:hypothetical protein B5X24_HaOG215960 [Helicoverpa armigera]|nr:hypothetical protein B5X24_HaOG215960 [Helicoverpa armigera]